MSPDRAGAQTAKTEENQQEQQESWAALAARVRAGDSTGMEELYRRFSRGVRLYLCRQLGPQELDDKIHDTFLIVVQALRRGEVREPDRLAGFIRTIVKRQVAAHIDTAVHNRREMEPIENESLIADGQESPEAALIERQRWQIMEKVLSGVSQRDREILTRFYLKEQTQEQICSEMNLTETQFRLLKSRAKARFAELGRRAVNRRPLQRLLLRNEEGVSH